MGKTIAVILMLGVLILSGCSYEEAAKENNMPKGDILPLEVGNKWVLQAPGTLVMNFEVTGFEDGVYELSYQENTIEPIFYYIEKKDGNYYLLKEIFDTELTVYEPALLFLKDDFEVGDIWTQRTLITKTDEKYEDWNESEQATVFMRVKSIKADGNDACYYISRESSYIDYDGYEYCDFCLRPGLGIMYHEFGLKSSSINLVSMAAIKEATVGGEKIR